ncbi:hypothetical protein PUN28_009592 [Cardiocondyla obscurior]|uniref:Uncharacterized protein n=1 Tax=Cardiocondyla obscurior TaxID=286306 RepID=A0AAW2FWG5_9HYME
MRVRTDGGGEGVHRGGSWDRSLCNFPHMSALICPHLPPVPTPRHSATTTAAATAAAAATAVAVNHPKLLRCKNLLNCLEDFLTLFYVLYRAFLQINLFIC